MIFPATIRHFFEGSSRWKSWRARWYFGWCPSELFMLSWGSHTFHFTIRLIRLIHCIYISIWFIHQLYNWGGTILYKESCYIPMDVLWDPSIFSLSQNPHMFFKGRFSSSSTTHQPPELSGRHRLTSRSARAQAGCSGPIQLLSIGQMLTSSYRDDRQGRIVVEQNPIPVTYIYIYTNTIYIDIF